MSAEQNKAVPRRVTEEAWNRGNLAVLDDLIASDFVRHTPLRPEGIGGIEGLKQHATGIRDAFPDAEIVNCSSSQRLRGRSPTSAADLHSELA